MVEIGGDPTVIQALAFLLAAVLLPLAGMMAAGGGLALGCALFARRSGSRLHADLASSLLACLTPRPGVWLLLPLGLALILLCQWHLYGRNGTLAQVWAFTVFLFAAGTALLHLCARVLSRDVSVAGLLAGSLGVLLAALSLFLFFSGESLLQRPDQAVLLPRRPDLLLSWHGTFRFLAFAVLSAAASGALLRWRGEAWTSSAGAGCPGGSFLFGAGILLLPPLLLAQLLTASPPSLSTLQSVLTGGMIVLAAIAFLFRPQGTVTGRTYFLTLLIFPLVVAVGHLGLDAAQSPAVVAGTAALAQMASAAAVPQTAPAAPVDLKPVEGEAVFQRICSPCHQFDRRVVGPPLGEVLPPYRDDPQALMDFIRAPVKKNPDYPAMPQLGLSEAEIKAVATWLLERTREN